ncbi:hypothetical protein NAT51_18285 [Flavobacterium amniphilum]|uniref:hypothetical protein n=1 Tax=Flavobacterium amniphilum TaxID=1834035 RepID=UPI00202A8B78|nr:hypothetical protein [Flavobacterium amniphilum]MCL9807481.1 hypothetical protein [Flavobacterium amniphilum]
MKSKLHVAGLVFVSLLFFSCSDDYDFDSVERKSNNVKFSHQTGENDDLKGIAKDSTSVIINEKDNADDGDPSNPKPPRG